jgi:7,8-dihydro-6-hydroxymethylpterin-pyrophosphokinase
MAFYFSPNDERLRIDIFLFNSERRNLALLVVFHDRFNKRAFLNLTLAGILLTVLPAIL